MGGTVPDASPSDVVPSVIGKASEVASLDEAFLEGTSPRFDDSKVVTGIIKYTLTEDVLFEKHQAFKADIVGKMASFKGFLKHDSFQTPLDAGGNEHTVIVTFACYRDLRTWLESKERIEAIAAAPFLKLAEPQVQDASEVIEVDTSNPQKPVRVPPPPKWKLALVTWIGVFSAVYCVLEAGVNRWIAVQVRQSYGVTTFGVLLCVVPPLVFAIIPLFTDVVGCWLRRPRREYSCEPMRTLQEGLTLFVPPPPAVDPADVAALQKKVERLEGVVHRLRSLTSRQCARRRAESEGERGGEAGAPDLEAPPLVAGGSIMANFEDLKAELKEGGPRDLRSALPVTGIAHHHVKWEYEAAFRLLCREFRDMQQSKFPGFVGMSTLHGKGDGLEYCQEFVNIWKYQSLKEMEVFSKSVERAEFLRKLRPMLESPSEITFAQDRFMHDAFSELLVTHGGNAPPQPPPVWKVCFCVVCGLMMCVWPVNQNFGPVLADWGVNEVWAATLILTFVNVILNTYVCLPFVMLLFGGWVSRQRDPQRGSFTTFIDKGFPNTWSRALASVVYFATLIILIATKAIP